MSLSFTRTEKVLMDQSAAGASNWIPLDTDYINTYTGVYSVSLETGDWVTVQGRLERSDRALIFNIAIVSATATSPGQITLPYNQIRVVKTGTAGNARVVLYG